MPGKQAAGKTKKSARIKELAVKDMRWKCDPAVFPFKTTKDAKPLDGILGQIRALKAIEMGLSMWSPGFNIYVAGASGTGKTTTVKALLEKLANKKTKPRDICYVNNFKDPAAPRVLKLPAGQGAQLRKDMRTLVQDLKRSIPELFDSENYKEKRNQIVEKHRNRQKELFKALEEEIKKDGFQLVQIQVGPYTRPAIIPLIDGQPVGIDQLESMSEAGNFPGIG